MPKRKIKFDRRKYNTYMNSKRWSNKKAEFRARKRSRKCYMCGKSNIYLEVHHRTYKDLGKEKLHQLVELCGNRVVRGERVTGCHTLVHAAVKRRKLKLYTAHIELKKKFKRYGKPATERWCYR